MCGSSACPDWYHDDGNLGWGWGLFMITSIFLFVLLAWQCTYLPYEERHCVCTECKSKRKHHPGERGFVCV